MIPLEEVEAAFKKVEDAQKIYDDFNKIVSNDSRVVGLAMKLAKANNKLIDWQNAFIINLSKHDLELRDAAVKALKDLNMLEDKDTPLEWAFISSIPFHFEGTKYHVQIQEAHDMPGILVGRVMELDLVTQGDGLADLADMLQDAIALHTKPADND